MFAHPFGILCVQIIPQLLFFSLWRKRYTHRKGEICNAVEMRTLERILCLIYHVILFCTIVWHNDVYGPSSVIHFPIFIPINCNLYIVKKPTEENYECMFFSAVFLVICIFTNSLSITFLLILKLLFTTKLST